MGPKIHFTLCHRIDVMGNSFNFSKTRIEALPPAPPGKRVEYHDVTVPSLLIRVTSNGVKTYYVRKRTGGADRYKLGRFPDLPLETARKMASQTLAEIASGKNPNEKKRFENSEPTLKALFENYLKGHARNRCTRVYDMEADFRRYLSDWSERKCSKISKVDAQERFNQVFEHNGPAAANHMLVLMRAVFNWNIRSGYINGENPWGHLKQFKIQSRERFLKPQEIAKFFAELENLKNTDVRDFVLISLYTGARRNNVLSMRWEEVDFDLKTWRIPRTKNGDWQIVPLTAEAQKVLEARKPSPKELGWVFPAKDSNNHLVELKRGWKTLLKAAELEDFRIHDLRRTLGSYMAMSNQSLKMIGAALGHKSSDATEIYARIANDALRSAMELAQENMLKNLTS